MGFLGWGIGAAGAVMMAAGVFVPGLLVLGLGVIVMLTASEQGKEL